MKPPTVWTAITTIIGAGMYAYTARVPAWSLHADLRTAAAPDHPEAKLPPNMLSLIISLRCSGSDGSKLCSANLSRIKFPAADEPPPVLVAFPAELGQVVESPRKVTGEYVRGRPVYELTLGPTLSGNQYLKIAALVDAQGGQIAAADISLLDRHRQSLSVKCEASNDDGALGGFDCFEDVSWRHRVWALIPFIMKSTG